MARKGRVRLNTDSRTWQETPRSEALDRIVREDPRYKDLDRRQAVQDRARLLKRGLVRVTRDKNGIPRAI